MSVSVEPDSTSVSLLQRVRAREVDAWSRFSVLYGPLVYSWCRHLGLQHADAADALQEVLRTIFEKIDGFRGENNAEGGGAFRGWLWTITRNQVRLHFRQQGNVPQPLGGSEAFLQWSEQPWDEASEIAAETRRWIVQRALQLIRGDFSPATWEAFERTGLQGEPAQQVATSLGIAEGTIRQAKFRVLRRLRQELEGQL